MTRLRLAKWLDDAGHAAGLWVAPEMAAVDEIMKAIDNTADDEVTAAVMDYMRNGGDRKSAV
jgi:hypothetical protein